MQNFFRTANGTVSAGLLKKLLTFPEAVFYGKKTLLKTSCYFRVYAVLFFRIIGRNVLARCSRLHFCCPDERASWKKLLMEKLIFFQIRTRIKIVWKFSGNISPTKWKVQSTCPHIHSENKFSIFWHKSLIPPLGTSAEAFSNYQTTQFGVFCR